MKEIPFQLEVDITIALTVRPQDIQVIEQKIKEAIESLDEYWNCRISHSKILLT
jgi:hypothetical protein